MSHIRVRSRSLSSATEKGNMDEVIEAIHNKSNIPRDRKPMLLQYFDKDFADWVNVDPTSILESMMRLQVLTEADDSDKDDSPAALSSPSSSIETDKDDEG